MADCVYGGNKANIKPGYIRYVDVNHDGEINSKDQSSVWVIPRLVMSIALRSAANGRESICLCFFRESVNVICTIPELGQDLWFKTVRFSRASSIRGAPKTRMRNISFFC